MRLIATSQAMVTSSVSGHMTQRLFFRLAALVVLFCIHKSASAVYVESLETYDAGMKASGLNFQGRIAWIRGQNSSGNTTYTQGVILTGGQKILTVAHVLPSGTTSSTLLDAGNGSNRLTDKGDVVAVQSWVRNTDYDLGIVTLSAPLSPSVITNFASVSTGSNYTIVGFGPIADATTASTNTHDIRAFDMRATGSSVVNFGLSNQDYFHLRSLSTNGRAYAIQGDSGSVLFDIAGNVVGSASSAGTEFLIATRYDATSNAVSWLSANGVFIPEPPSFLFFSSAAMLLTQRRQRREN